MVEPIKGTLARSHTDELERIEDELLGLKIKAGASNDC